MLLLESIRKRSGDFAHAVGPQSRRGAEAVRSYADRMPSQTFLWAAFGAIAGSLALQSLRKNQLSLFVGQWAPTFLALGLYHKLSKRQIFRR